MFNFIKKFFTSEEEFDIAEQFPKKEKISKKNCANCPAKETCKTRGQLTPYCDYAVNMEDFDESLDTLLIIDDNEGMVSFLKDDIEFFNEEGFLKSSELNVLGLTGKHAAFSLSLLIEKKYKLNIKWAIIDITLGGSIVTEDGIVKYTGVDVFEKIYKLNKDIKFVFYTGNNLNPYIKSNKKLIDEFKAIHKDDIMNYVLYKTSMDMDARRKLIKEKLFNFNKEV